MDDFRMFCRKWGKYFVSAYLIGSVLLLISADWSSKISLIFPVLYIVVGGIILFRVLYGEQIGKSFDTLIEKTIVRFMRKKS